MKIGTFANGTIGFDCNVPLTVATARNARALDYAFVMRYVGRVVTHYNDLSANELAIATGEGLAVGIVQHVELVPWVPRIESGHIYGMTAAFLARKVGAPTGITLWCDLEGVAKSPNSAHNIGYNKEWHRCVSDGGFNPRLYVGDSCGLTNDELYYRLPYDGYWNAYNNNSDQSPSVRGYQMFQRERKAATLTTVGDPQLFDGNGERVAHQIDSIHADKLGGTPIFIMP